MKLREGWLTALVQWCVLITGSTQISHRLLRRGCELMFKLSIKINCHSWGESAVWSQHQSEAGDNKLKIHKSSQHLPESPQSPLCSASVVCVWSGPGTRPRAAVWPALVCREFGLLSSCVSPPGIGWGDEACGWLRGQHTAPALAMLWKLIQS